MGINKLVMKTQRPTIIDNRKIRKFVFSALLDFFVVNLLHTIYKLFFGNIFPYHKTYRPGGCIVAKNYIYIYINIYVKNLVDIFYA